VDKDKVVKSYRVITPHGEADVSESEDGSKDYMPLKTVDLGPLPQWFGGKYVGSMMLFHTLLTTIRSRSPNRQLPVTRKELENSGVDRKIIRRLVEAGMLKECLLQVGTKERNLGSRSCLYYTDQGRALIRANVDPSYAITENTDVTV